MCVSFARRLKLLQVRLSINNDVKKAGEQLLESKDRAFKICLTRQSSEFGIITPCAQVKAANLRLEVPEGWEATLSCSIHDMP